MKILKSNVLTLTFSALLGGAPLMQSTHAQDGSFLDPPHQKLRPAVTHPVFSALHLDALRPFADLRWPIKSDVLQIVNFQTDVRSQGARGTCSIFASTALLEALLVSYKSFDAHSLNLSEEWLEYVKDAETGIDGSTTTMNIGFFKKYGMPAETSLPYIGETWKTVDDSPLAKERCRELTSSDLKRCLAGHLNPQLLRAPSEELLDPSHPLHNPEFAKARSEALKLKNTALADSPPYSYVSTEGEVKKLLNQGIPVLLDLDFYYGAWNHRKGTELGLERNMDQWSKGIVGYPEPGSLDRKVSHNEPAGHSILIVGYNDDEDITIETQMANGDKKTFTYRGVYYFKNSWGTSNFGTETVIEGRALAGYGRITQKYAHNLGEFYSWQWGSL